jgi:hypothetical protein
MVAPPLDAGAVKATLALALPAVAVTPVGAPGTVADGVGVGVGLGVDVPPPPQAASSRQDKASVSAFMASRLLGIYGGSVKDSNELQCNALTRGARVNRRLPDG